MFVNFENFLADLEKRASDRKTNIFSARDHEFSLNKFFQKHFVAGPIKKSVTRFEILVDSLKKLMKLLRPRSRECIAHSVFGRKIFNLFFFNFYFKLFLSKSDVLVFTMTSAFIWKANKHA